MKLIHHKKQDGCSIFSLSGKAAAFIFFVFVMQKTTSARSMRGFDNLGNETDRVALLAVKNQLVDHAGGVLSSWNNSVHHCNWVGVTCGPKHNRVTVLDLNSRGLAGTISPFIGNLSFLKNVSLYNNSLHGQIPSKLGNLFRLRELWISNNTLVGKIPANLSSCINLRVFSIGFNKLEGKLPTELRALSKLEDFSVSYNNLTGPLFDIIQNFTSLMYISAPWNSFTGTIPDSINRMQNLNYLALAMNKLSGALPTSLFNISSLQFIDLPFNQLHGELPTHMGLTIPYLIWLNLAGNYFSGSIPMTITNLTNLEYIELDQNSFTGWVPRDLGQSQNLYYFSVIENYLTGDLNFIDTLVNCTQLSFLSLGVNMFSGILPISIVNLSTTLTSLILGASSIRGTFPAGITKLINLEVLEIAETKVSGYLPRDIGKLHKLVNLDLHSNRLTGTIPSSLGDLSFLSELYLGGNKLEGSVPTSLVNCQSLLYLNLSYNQLSGTLSSEIFEGSATFIELKFSHNHLDGTLPSAIGRLTTLQTLKIDGNFFHGDVPSSFTSLASLQEINFSRNNLSGTIPVFFSRFPSIQQLDLSYNNFEGRVPTNSVFANATAVSLVGNNRLCGGVQQLHLPKCIENEGTLKRKRSLSHTLKVVIPVISAFVGVLIMATGIYVACNRKQMAPPPSGSLMGESYKKVSYQQLLKATGGFSPDSLLGAGSFGSVFKGVLDGEMVAVKVLNLRHCAASKSFTAECRALRNVRHRNLVGIITACSSIDSQRNDFRALVYEFMPNGSLDKWLHGGVVGKMSLPQRVGVAMDVAHALNYLHNECETPIVHCDLKPSNILLDNDMIAHVGDFGLARFLNQPRHPNQSSTIGIKGTIGYAAPEYGLGSEVSTAGDVYSYGILLLELMTGKSPTDNMFKEDYNLHMYAAAAQRDQVLQIVDPALEEDNLDEKSDDRSEITDAHQRRVECIIYMISVGVSCSNHLPHDRMTMTDAINSLQSARDSFLNAKRR